MLRKSFIFTIFLTISLSTSAQSIEGNWNTQDQNTIVKIAKDEKGRLRGKIISSDNPRGKGILILKEIQKFPEGYKARIFSPNRRRWFNCKIYPQTDKLEIKVTAGIRSRTVYWIKED